jgi:hypothetical protein
MAAVMDSERPQHRKLERRTSCVECHRQPAVSRP